MSEQVSFESMLQDAVNTPGKLHEAYSMFHNYSIGNAWWAMLQCAARGIQIGPINTYKRWKEMGRQVRKGEKAITLLMPVTNKIEVDDKQNPGEHKEITYTRFIAKANWFVLSQTDGEQVPLPQIPDFDVDKALETLGITKIDFDMPNGNCQGYALPGKKIAVSPIAALPIKTTFHEAAHVLLGHTEQSMFDFDERTPKNLREVEAESVAYVCIGALNLDGQEFSRGYIQHWLKGSEIPEKSAQKIFATANQILVAGRKGN